MKTLERCGMLESNSALTMLLHAADDQRNFTFPADDVLNGGRFIKTWLDDGDGRGMRQANLLILSLHHHSI